MKKRNIEILIDFCKYEAEIAEYEGHWKVLPLWKSSGLKIKFF
jgi:hypothetical protein